MNLTLWDRTQREAGEVNQQADIRDGKGRRPHSDHVVADLHGDVAHSSSFLGGVGLAGGPRGLCDQYEDAFPFAAKDWNFFLP